MVPIIEINCLSFTYPDGTQALREINLIVEAGEKIALVGPNGAGKSTLILHLNGILDSSGQVRIAGLQVEKENLKTIRSSVGLVFQNPDDQLFSPTIYEDVAYGPTYLGLDKATIQQRVEQALHEVGMSGYVHRNPYHLSGGEKKRAAIATVLSMQPSILVFDEPSAGLDPRARRELMELLARLPQTIVIATHDLDLALRLTGRTIVMDNGMIAADGPTSSILGNADLLLEHGLR